ncbi:MAG TPA: recombinase family protein, partial [Anaerolineales bacterium]|nr:recombinase family protein [Anaerolineales bacterium]
PAGLRRWIDPMVRQILTNRFYCGEIVFGAERRVLDPRTGRVKIERTAPSNRLIAKGAHQPLWDKHTQVRIDNEFKARGKSYSGQRTHRLSNLLYCGVCHARVHVGYWSGSHYAGPDDENRMWHCSADRQHVNLYDSDLLPRVIAELVDALRHVDDFQLPVLEDKKPLLSNALADIHAQRDRLTDAYLSGVLGLPEYTKRAVGLDARLAELENKLSDSDAAISRRREQATLLAGLVAAIESVPDFVLSAPEQEVNARLRAWVGRIYISPEHIEIEFR